MTGSSNCRPNARELNDDSKIVIARPTAIAEMKKKNGSAGEYQNGCSFVGMIRYSVPSEDWCSVESRMPRITRRNQAALTHLSGVARLKRSSTAVENSNISTVV